LLIYYRQFEHKTEKVLYISYWHTETCDAGNWSPICYVTLVLCS